MCCAVPVEICMFITGTRSLWSHPLFIHLGVTLLMRCRRLRVYELWHVWRCLGISNFDFAVFCQECALGSIIQDEQTSIMPIWSFRYAWAGAFALQCQWAWFAANISVLSCVYGCTRQGRSWVCARLASPEQEQLECAGD